MTRRAENQSTDRDALDEHLRARAPELFGSACLILGDARAAEDVTADALERARKFRNALRGGDVDRWLYRILVSGCFTHARRRQPLASTSSAAPEPRPISSALAQLPLHQRAAFVLAFYSGLDEPAIATALASRVATVRRDVAVARTKVDELIHAHNHMTHDEEGAGRALAKEAVQ